MTIPDDILMAFADGELDQATRQMVEAAERDDPDVRRRLATHRQLRAGLQTAFAATLDEPVPERLVAAVRRPAATAAPASPVAPIVTVAPIIRLADRRRAAKSGAAARKFGVVHSACGGAPSRSDRHDRVELSRQIRRVLPDIFAVERPCRRGVGLPRR